MGTKFTAILFSAVVVAGGCASKKESAASGGNQSGEAFLRQAMERNAAFKTFQADGTVAIKVENSANPVITQRKIRLQSPNRFSVNTSAAGANFVSVSDGAKWVEYQTPSNMPGGIYKAPKAVDYASSPLMREPRFAGSLLYEFFGGAANYGYLVDDTQVPVTLGAEEKTPDGEMAKVVSFYARSSYGNVKALIGEKTGRVFRITYDSDPIFRTYSNPEVKSRVQAMLDKTPAGPQRDRMLKEAEPILHPVHYFTEETYTNFHTDETLSADTFNTTPPAGMKLTPQQTPFSGKPPVRIGEPALDFTVNTLDGKAVTLSSLKGHVVLIDFWATWCGPCKKELPDTNRLAQEEGPRGLKVMAISDEEPGKVSGFVHDNQYSFPTYIDKGGATNRLYQIASIPTTMIIDADGKMSSYLVGLQDMNELRVALDKAGYKAK